MLKKITNLFIKKRMIMTVIMLLFFSFGFLTLGQVLKMKAATSMVTHISQADWEAGTVASTLDTTTSAGDIILASSAYSLTHTDYADFSGGIASSTIDLSTNMGDIQLSKIIQAAWTENGVPMATTTATSIDDFEAISDGLGGVYLVWQDDPSGNHNIYAQRIDSDGNFLWDYGGVDVVTQTDDQAYPLVATTSDGIIISWLDTRNGNVDIYAQKLNSSGVVQWTMDGVAVCASTTTQRYKRMVQDNEDGVIIAWYEDTGFYAQRINSSGVVQWGEDGVKIEDYSHIIFNMVPSGDGGAVIVWQDDRGGDHDIYAQKINSSGIAQWTAGGITVSAALGDQSLAITGKTTVKSLDDFIIFWHDARNGNLDIYAQKLNSSGVAQWTTDGVEISTSTYYGYLYDVKSDGAGGAFVSWIINEDDNLNIYAQKISSSGEEQWTTGGEQVTNLDGGESAPKVMPDSSGNLVIVWQDQRSDGGDVYVQKFNSLGLPLWTKNGVAISDIDEEQGSPMIITDGSDGVIIFWEDARKITGDDIYATRILSNPDYTYNTSGVFTSSAIDASSVYSWYTLTSTETTPNNTTVAFETRTKENVATNFALTGEVLASSEFDVYLDDYIIDGDNDTFWINDFSTDTTPTLTITLAETSSVGYVSMHYPLFEGEIYYCADYTIQVSEDGTNFTTVVEETGNTDSDVTNSFSAVDAQKVRFTCANAPLYDMNIVLLGEFGIYDSNPDVSWTEWEAISGNSIQSAAGRYIQYRMTLSTTDTSVTPTVSAVTVSSVPSYSSSGMYISSVVDSADTTTIWDTITADDTTSASTTITYATRSGTTDTPDGTWSNWATTTSAIGSASVQYLQYRAFLSTTDSSYTPTLSAITLDYSTVDETPAAEEESTSGGAAVIITPITSPTVTDPETGEEIETEFSVNIAPPANFNTIIPTVTSREVNLSLVGGPNTVNMAISEYPSFAFANLIPYEETTSFVLSEALGEKTIYAKFYTDQGVASDPVSCLVNLVKEDDAPITPDMSNDASEDIVEKEKKENVIENKWKDAEENKEIQSNVENENNNIGNKNAVNDDSGAEHKLKRLSDYLDDVADYNNDLNIKESENESPIKKDEKQLEKEEDKKDILKANSEVFTEKDIKAFIQLKMKKNIFTIISVICILVLIYFVYLFKLRKK